MNNTNFASKTFTWALEATPIENPPKPNGSSQQPVAISDADLFELLLGDEAQKANEAQSSTPAFPHIVPSSTDEESSSANEDASMAEYTETKPAALKKASKSSKPPATSTGRLDFRPISDMVSDSQLKSMTSKERRQLRNKISARNFRNRRKEYVESLEEELNQQKAENSQLKLELKWANQKMDNLQKENDKLRVDLMLNGIGLPSNTAMTAVAPSTNSNVAQQFSASPYLLDSTNLLNSTLNFNTHSNNSSSSDESSLSSPPNLLTDFPDNWDFVLPEEQVRDTFLSHAVVPDWNIDHVLKKETSALVPAQPNLIQQYPLLAPALMSIVLTHTMNMSTSEMLATAKLNPAPPTVQFKNDTPFAGSTMMTDKEAKAVWDILEPFTLMENRNKTLALEADESKEDAEESQPATTESTTTETGSTQQVGHTCFINILQQRLLRCICEFAATYCTSKEPPAKPEEKKRLLCRQFQRARRYINAC